MDSYHFEQLNTDVCKTYLFYEEDTKESAIVDPKINYLTAYLDLLKSRGLTLKWIFETHTHADHLSSAAALKDATGADIYMHENAPAPIKCVNKRVHDGDEVKVGKIPVKIFSTPGHTKDSLSYYLPGKLLTGDVLFLDGGGAARTDLPGGDPAEQWESHQRIKALPDDTMIYPGHDYRNRTPSSLGDQKKNNPFLQYEKKEEYVKFLDEQKLGPADWMKFVIAANAKCSRDPNAAEIPEEGASCEVKGTLPAGVASLTIDLTSIDDIKKRLDSGEEIIIVDVRDKKAITGPMGKIEGSINIPITDVNASLKNLEKYKDREVVFVCVKGKRSMTAAQLAKHAGFKNPVIMKGGMTAWSEKFGNKK
ncbi:MAG: MBL fold metallo-hydrolase [Promethearchaeota archaeon]